MADAVSGISSASRRWTAWAGYLGLTGFLAMEVARRRPVDPAPFRTTADDAGSTRGLVICYALAATLPLVDNPRMRPLMPAAAGPIGIALQGAGIALRAESMRVLGRSYTRTLRTESSSQRLIEHGPYRWVRHPGYAGSLLVWTGFAFTRRSVPVAAAGLGLIVAGYGRRIAVEDAMLVRDIPGYRRYAARTKRLVPGVW